MTTPLGPVSLVDLQACLYRVEYRDEPWRERMPDGSVVDRFGPREYHVPEPNFAHAQGVAFLCPKCWLSNRRSDVGTHWVMCWFAGRGVGDDVVPKPGRWSPVGSGLADLTLRAGSSSVALVGGCNGHFWIEKGAAVRIT